MSINLFAAKRKLASPDTKERIIKEKTDENKQQYQGLLWLSDFRVSNLHIYIIKMIADFIDVPIPYGKPLRRLREIHDALLSLVYTVDIYRFTCRTHIKRHFALTPPTPPATVL